MWEFLGIFSERGSSIYIYNRLLLEPDKNPLDYSISLKFYSTTDRGRGGGSFNLVYRARRSQVRAPITHIPLRITIPTYISLYGEARVAYTSVGEKLVGT
jgi:hypothetical protein